MMQISPAPRSLKAYCTPPMRFAAALPKPSEEETLRAGFLRNKLAGFAKGIHLETTPIVLGKYDTRLDKTQTGQAEKTVINFTTPGGHSFTFAKNASGGDNSPQEWYQLYHKAPVPPVQAWLQTVGLIGSELGKESLELMEHQAAPHNMYMVRMHQPGEETSLSNATCYEAYPEPELLASVRELFLNLETRLQKQIAADTKTK